MEPWCFNWVPPKFLTDQELWLSIEKSNYLPFEGLWGSMLRGWIIVTYNIVIRPIIAIAGCPKLLYAVIHVNLFFHQYLAGSEGNIWDCANSWLEKGRKSDEQDSVYR